jgi:hypothetical protein
MMPNELSQLAIDLWRWRTGRCSMDDLGWIPA